MSKGRTVLYLDLRKKTSEVKVHADVHEFVGGLGIGLKLLADLRQLNPVIFSIGPLNNAFPFVSKTCCLFYDEAGNLVESYGGGRFGLVFSLTSFEAIVIVGHSYEPVLINISSNKVEFIESKGESSFGSVGLAGRYSAVRFGLDEALIDNYFQFDPRLGLRLSADNLKALVISADRSFKIEKKDEYAKLYQEILLRGRDVSEPYGNAYSCGGCPGGCVHSHEAQFNKSLALPYCLVACGFASNVFNSVPTVFSCLNSLGIDYSHETLEDVSVKINQMRTLYAHL